MKLSNEYIFKCDFKICLPHCGFKQECEGEKKGEIHFHATVRFDRITCGTTLWDK